MVSQNEGSSPINKEVDLDKLTYDFFKLPELDRFALISKMMRVNFGPLMFFEVISMTGRIAELRKEVDRTLALKGNCTNGHCQCNHCQTVTYQMPQM